MAVDLIGPDLAALSVGDELSRTVHTLDRDSLVRYAGASGDFNPIHYNDAVAEQEAKLREQRGTV